jgi:hypothetical protein
MGRYGNGYGEDDMGMRWLKAHDPDAQTGGWAQRHGIVDAAAAKRVRRHEVSFEDPDVIVRDQVIHCPGCKESRRRHVHA